jgi:hypothetical protein
MATVSTVLPPGPPPLPEPLNWPISPDAPPPMQVMTANFPAPDAVLPA